MNKLILQMKVVFFIFITICVIATHATADNVTYTYDDAGRLTKANYGNSRAIIFTYDKAGNIIEKKVTTTADPIPDIKANSSDVPITLGTSDNLSINISLAAGSNMGVDSDWWVAVNTPFAPPNDWFHYDLSSGWIPGLSFTYQGPLSDLGTFTVLNMAGLPVGTYTFYFAVDTNMNGVLDFGELYFDSVVVNIMP